MMLVLLKKELQEHWLVAVASLGLSVVLAVMFVMSLVIQQAPSYLPAAVGFAASATPGLAVYWCHRLFVREHQQGTYEFLAATPLSPVHLAVVKAAVALFVVLAIAEGGALAIAWIAAHREIVGTPRLTRLFVAVVAHGVAWVGLAAAIAQLGRHRTTTWFVLGVFLLTLDNEAPQLAAYVDGLGSLTAETTEMANIIGSSQVMALVWGAVGFTAAFVLVVRRGGSAVRRLFEPGDAGQRAGAITAISAAVAVAMVVAVVRQRSEPAIEGIAHVNPVSRVQVAAAPGSPLFKLAVALDDVLTELAGAIGEAPWPDIVLKARYNSNDPEPVRAEWVGANLHVAVELTSKDQVSALRPVLRELLMATQGGWPADHRPDAWMVPGLAAAWLESHGDDLSQMAMKAAYANAMIPDASALRDWPAMVRRLGKELSEAVSWVGLSEAAKACGTRAVLLARAAPVSAPTTMARLTRVLMDGEANTLCGMAVAAHAERWKSTLAAMAVQHEDELDVLPRLPALTVVRGQRRPVWIAIRGNMMPIPKGAELWWSPLDPLESLELDRLDIRRAAVSEGSHLRLAVDPRARLAATVALRIPALEATVVSGWDEVAAP